MKTSRILVVDDEDSLRRIMQVQLERRGFEVVLARDGEDALSCLAKSPFNLVLTDLRMPRMSGLELLKRIRESYPEIEAIVITAIATIENAVEAMQAGAYHYVTKPVRFEELSIVIDRALERSRLIDEVKTLREQLNDKTGFDNIIGHSGPLLATLDIAARAARSSSTVLIEGQTGTGKELLARAIHFNSPRREKPFLAVNCGAIPKDLLESELYGYKKGAFTGAQQDKIGKIEACNGGTLFLDEIGEMPLEVQVKLLRLVQEGEVQKLGAVEPVKVDVRIVAATHRNLRKMADEGEFREDLYYRLAVIPMTLPPLRERLDDVPELVRVFWQRGIRKHAREDLVLPESQLPHFRRYHWPGNIRELENLIERIIVLSRGPEVTASDLPEVLQRQKPLPQTTQFDLPVTPISLDAVEKELIEQALERFDGNQTKAAQFLDLTRKTLIYRMERHGLRKRED